MSLFFALFRTAQGSVGRLSRHGCAAQRPAPGPRARPDTDFFVQSRSKSQRLSDIPCYPHKKSFQYGKQQSKSNYRIRVIFYYRLNEFYINLTIVFFQKSLFWPGKCLRGSAAARVLEDQGHNYILCVAGAPRGEIYFIALLKHHYLSFDIIIFRFTFTSSFPLTICHGFTLLRPLQTIFHCHIFSSSSFLFSRSEAKKIKAAQTFTLPLHYRSSTSALQYPLSPFHQ